MGYAEGGQTLEYDLEYARELNGLSGGITPAQIWKTYMEQALEGEPIEHFEGVEMPTQEQTTPTDSETPNDGPRATDSTADAPVIGALGDDATNVEPSSASPSSAAPSSASPSTVSPSSAAPSSASPSSASPSRRPGGRGLR
jgi:membrane peptidoglycan carboxypeptidase